MQTTGVQVSALARYPIKSCRGTSLDSTQVRPWGLVGDRRWMLVDAAGHCVTAREHPRLILVEVDLAPAPDRPDGGNAVRIRAAGRPDLEVAEPTAGDPTPVTIWRDEVPATVAADEAHAWFSDYLHLAVRLVYLDDPGRRAVNPQYGRASDVVNLADAFPLLLTNVGSLAAINDLVSAGRWPGEGPLPMTRFRPNVVVDGAPAWAEDEWRQLRIGEVTFRVARGCGRCVLTTIDPETAEKGKEPLATLAQHRNWDGNVWFGMNLIPDVDAGGPAPVIRLGDPVEVLA